MFGIGTGELFVLFILVLLIYGPKKLPELAAKLGKVSREARSAFDEVRSAMAQSKEEVEQLGQEIVTEGNPRGTASASERPEKSNGEVVEDKTPISEEKTSLKKGEESAE